MDAVTITMMAEESAKQRAKEAEEQQRIDKDIQQRILSQITQVTDAVILEHSDISEIATAPADIQNDPQTRRFLEFVQLATNFASLKFVDRLRSIPELINSIKKLIIEMIKEIKEFADIANELQDLIQSFIKLVVNTKRNMQLTMSPLQRSIDHMEVIADALSSVSGESLEDRDTQDIQLALEGMSSGIKNLLKLVRSSKQESGDLDEKINTMKRNLQEKRIVIEGRLELAKLAPWAGVGGGVVTGVIVAGATAAAPVLGGAGAIVIGNLVFPPMAAIIAAALVGGVLFGSIVYLVKKLWARHNDNALKYLSKILNLLVKLSDANLNFSNYMAKAEVNSSRILDGVIEIQRTITSGSERYRKINARICKEAIQSTNEMITCINEIIKIDMSEWSNSSNILHFASSSSNMAVCSVPAIEN